MSSDSLPPVSAAFILLAISNGMAITGAASDFGARRSVNEGVFTAQQADRGAEIYAEHCSACHGANMRGGPASPGVAGLEFKFLWNGKTVGELYESARTKMPPGKAGLLSDQEYVDVIAAILSGNAFPPGEDGELPTDQILLNNILIKWAD